MAQERKKRRIVLASVLKPVDDTRMFEKIGTSLAQSGLYEVLIIGYPSRIPSHPGIEFFPSQPFKRISAGRFLARWKVFVRILHLSPSAIIIGTHELLLPAILLKIFSNTTVLYDVRENYYRNIIHSGNFPPWVKWPIAMLVRFKEKVLAPAIDHFFLAEKEYENEFKFHRGGWTVLENKASHQPTHPTPRSRAMRLLFSGTLAESTGVFQAIRLARELHTLDATVTLTIIGYAAMQGVREKIQREVQGHHYIKLIGGDMLVPHPDILAAIRAADFGIISYPHSAHTANSVPTKLFEYLNDQLPIILDRHWMWTVRYESIQPFAYHDFSNPDYPALLKELKMKVFYTSTAPDVSWKSEEIKLLDTIEKIHFPQISQI